MYLESLRGPYQAALKKAHVAGFAFSFSQSVIFFAYAGAFFFGAYMIKEGEMDFVDVFKVFSAIVFGAMALGQASAFAPDAAKAQASSEVIFPLLDTAPTIDAESDNGEKPHAETVTGTVTFRDCKFRYPTRPDVEVLQGLSLTVDPGQTLALVGTSGCGKSTTVALIERFYDVEAGSVLLDRYNVKNLNVPWLRSQIGIVSQEPILFDCSIRDNIAYGDNSRTPSMDEIIKAARNANIHEFISSLPDGYDTNVGDKGTQLSGGQKQRVAIARALLRNPRILLLDEATSALDTESEKIVQEALDKARAGRTCIVIAHRLSTIQNADKICVIKHGTDISWFDDHKNGTGALTTRLATDASQVQGAAGARLGSLVQNVANMGTAIVIAFIYGWQLTLVIFAFLPFIAIGGALEMKILQGVAGQNKEALEGAGKIANEGIENIRTVASLTKEEKIHQLYIENLRPPYVAALRKAHIAGFAFSFSQSVIFFAYAASFYFGAYMIKEGEMDFTAVFKVFSAIVFGAMALGQASAFAPDAAKAQASSEVIFPLLDTTPTIDAESENGEKPHEGPKLTVQPGQTLNWWGDQWMWKVNHSCTLERFYDVEAGSVPKPHQVIFPLLDTTPTIDAESENGEKPHESTVTSKVTFSDCKFRYPTRPDIEVLQGLTLTVQPGQTLALVGTSGCGKSTTVALIERFYDVEAGSVQLDRYNVKDLNVSWLRSQIGIVSQEPILFDCSIRDNIAYGDNSRTPSMDEIIKAARNANIHEFVSSLPDGYDTNVGDKGTQLSGGQKQRVAIARALLRNPRILLLDEATSALDTESEKIVQEALDKAREGRTCIVIAHRLSTIQNADKICVIKHGTVSEEGKHSDLMAKQGIYYKLNMAQKRQK
ncbi:ABCB1 [Mytilus coruscus]|uniref:ABCB1 n=1 Tax=Mytilus coruscus TaxID=42192 RepID=A0A6J8D1H0_MYTCO|nr:ABCB1 [Mytilus coruscus]